MSTMQFLRENRNFRYFWAGQGVSEFGAQISHVAVPLVAVVVLSATAAEVGVLTAIQRISFPLLGLFAGVLIDRMDRRRVLLATDLGQALMLSLIPVAWLMGWLSLPLLLVVMLVTGAMFVFFEIGFFSYVPSLVRRPADLLTANTLLQSTSATAMILGPVIAGLLVAAVGAPQAVIGNVVTFLVSFVFLLLIREHAARPDGLEVGSAGAAPPEPARQSVFADMRAGWGRVFRSPLLRGLAEMSGIYLFFYTAFQALVVLFLVNVLEMTSALVGVFFGAFGVGVLVGAVLGGLVARLLGIGLAIVVAAAVGDIAATVTAAFAQPTSVGWAMAAVAAVLMGLGTQITTVNAVSIRQAVTPAGLQGRVNGTMRVIAWSVAPVGALVGGLLGEWLGVRGGLVVAAAGTLLAVVRICFSPVVRLRTLPEAPEEDDAASGAGHDPSGGGAGGVGLPDAEPAAGAEALPVTGRQ